MARMNSCDFETDQRPLHAVFWSFASHPDEPVRVSREFSHCVAASSICFWRFGHPIAGPSRLPCLPRIVFFESTLGNQRAKQSSTGQWNSYVGKAPCLMSPAQRPAAAGILCVEVINTATRVAPDQRGAGMWRAICHPAFRHQPSRCDRPMHHYKLTACRCNNPEICFRLLAEASITPPRRPGDEHGHSDQWQNRLLAMRKQQFRSVSAIAFVPLLFRRGGLKVNERR